MLRYFTVAMIILLHTNIYSQSDPNNDTSWNWRASSTFIVYPQALGSIQVNTTSPFLQGGISEAVFDNRPEDGWVLVMRDFGTSSRGASVPYFALYNKYQGLLRVFPYIVMNGDYEKGFINIYWGTTIKTAALTFLNNTAWGVNTLDSTKNNSSAAFAPVVNGNWAFADFPMAYEYNVSSFTNPNFHFEIWGSTTSNLNLTIQGDILQHFGNNQSANLPNPGFFQVGGDFQLAQKHVQGTQSTWTGWKSVIDNIGNGIDSNTTSSALLNLRNSVKSLSTSWTISNLSGIGVAVGLLDFFITGGRLTQKEQPAPINFKANFTATGTIRTDVRVAGAITLPLSGSNITDTVTATNLLYNNPLGILNLRETPIVEHRRYDQPVGSNITRETHSFKVKNDLVIDLNPNSDLEIQDIKAALVYVPKTQPIAQEFLGYADQGHSNIDNTPIELESATAGVFEFRTPYVNAYSVKYQKITIPLEALNDGFNVQGGEWIPFNMPRNTALGKLYLKIHATLRVKNSTLDRQPVVFLATYNVINQEGDGVNEYWPTPPAPFAVNINRKFEAQQDEILPTAFGYTGVQNVTVTTPSIIGSTFFSFWSDGNNNLTRTFTENTNIKALYKYPHHSNTGSFVNSGQRKVIRSEDGYLHLVFESMGLVWYERSTDNGASWQIMNGGKPIDKNPSKSPSIDFYYGYQRLIIVYQTWAGDNNEFAAIKAACFKLGELEFTTTVEQSYLSTYSEVNYKPAVGYASNDKIAVAWEDYGVWVLTGVLSFSTNQISWNNIICVDNYNSANINPTIAAYKTTPGTATFHLAWQNNYGTIRYCNLTAQSNGSFLVSAVDQVSQGCGFPVNYYPSINVSNSNDVQLVWIGTPYYGSSYRKTLSRSRTTNWSSSFAQYGNNVLSPDAAFYTGSSVVSWSENPSGNTFTNKFIKYGSVKTAGTTGKDVRIFNASTLQDMHLVSFTTNNLPYAFTHSANLNSINKDNSLVMASGVQAVAFKDGVEYFFRIGDINFNGSNIDFESFEDTVGILSLEDLNTNLITNSFTTNEANNLVYSIEYGVTDSVLALVQLQNKFISFKVELIDQLTGVVVAELNNIQMDGNNVEKLKTTTFSFNITGLPSSSLAIRLKANNVLEPQYAAAVIKSDESVLLKSNLIVLNLSGTETVKEYALDQNYPNPFNPNTTIKFQIPNDGIVSLKVFDILGNEVATLINEEKTKGRYEVDFNASSLASGVYIYKIQVGSFINSKK